MGNEVKRYVFCLHCTRTVGCCQSGIRAECEECPEGRECPKPEETGKPSHGHCKTCAVDDWCAQPITQEGAPR